MPVCLSKHCQMVVPIPQDSMSPMVLVLMCLLLALLVPVVRLPVLVVFLYLSESLGALILEFGVEQIAAAH